jgi:uncharacterized protein (TIGR02145 family)
MKRKIDTLFFVLFISTIVFAQDSLFVYKSGLVDCKSDISSIDSINFLNNSTALIYKSGSIVYSSALSAIDSIIFSNNSSIVDLIKTPWKDNDTYLSDPSWKTDQYLSNNVSSPYSYAGIYAYENLTIGDNVNIYSSGISELVLKVKGTLTLGKNVKIWVRNGYYSSAPGAAISTLTTSNLGGKGIIYRNVYLLPSIFGKGGNGGNGSSGDPGGVKSIYLGSGSYYTIEGVGGSGGGGGGGGFGGGIAGTGGAAGAGAGSEDDGYAGKSGNANGGDGGYGGANSSIGIGGGATGLGTHGVMSSDKIGAGGGGGGGNGGAGSSGGSSDLYYGGGAGFGGDGGGGGGYGGGILYIAAQRITYDEKYPPNFIVSGQVGGASFQSGCSGSQGQGGLLIINTETSTLPDSIWNLKNVCVAPSEKGGHGIVKGNPQKIFINADIKSDGTTITEPNDSTISDIDGNIYHTVKIGNQTWMVENLKTTKYNDGTAISSVTDQKSWNSRTTGAYCCYSNDTLNKKLYGCLYNWYAVKTGKLAPSGWHVPTDAEWTILKNYLIANGYNYDGSTSSNYIAKALAANTGWTLSTITGAVGNDLSKNNKSGFYALPGGIRHEDGFMFIGNYSYWWSNTTQTNASYAWLRSLYYNNSDFDRGGYNKFGGFSVRCVRDN